MTIAQTALETSTKEGYNVGQPGLVIPAGFTKSGLPLSLQLVGHPLGEAVLYARRG
jgi:Asp-tRNA(Asn)/Glu-tRNA(Gln) amidotransferase A subunit family amidase